MFKKDYQGGAYFDVYSVQGSQPLTKLKVIGPETGVQKKYDNDLRTFVVSLEGESTTSKIALPKNNKQSLHLTQQYLVFQVLVMPGKSFSLEVCVTDKSNVKQRVLFSTNHREVMTSSLHVKMPCSIIERDIWLNLCLDMNGLMNPLYDGWKMQTIDNLVLSANCKLKRIFTLKHNPVNGFGIPEGVRIRGAESATQVIDIDAFIKAGIQIRSGTGGRAHASRRTPTQHQERDATSAVRRPDELTLPKLKRTDSLPKLKSPDSPLPKLHRTDSNRLRSTSSDKENVDNGKYSSMNDLSCSGMGITTLPKLTGLNREKDKKHRIVKSAEVLKSKGRQDLVQDLKCLSKSADNRSGRRRVLNKAHSVPNIKIKPKITLDNISTKSTADMRRKTSEKDESSPFKSQSTKVLPNIKEKGDDPPRKMNHRYSNRVSVDDDNPFDSSSYHGEPNSSIVLDDNNKYLTEQINNGMEDESVSLNSSGYATSPGSDMYIYSSSPHSINHHNTPIGSTEMKKSATLQLSFNDTPTKRSSESIKEQGVASNGCREVGASQNADHASQNTGQNADHGYSSGNYVKACCSHDVDSHEGGGTCHRESLHQNGGSYANRNESFDQKSIDDPTNKESSRLKEPSDSKVSTGQKEYSNSNKCNNTKESRNADDSTNPKKSNSPKESNKPKPNQPTLQNNSNPNASYVIKESSETDTMSWLNSIEQSTSSDPANKTKGETQQGNPSSGETLLQRRIRERLGSLIIDGSVDDTECCADGGSSDGSSDDSAAAEKLQERVKNYRYQDEMKSINCSFDLSATSEGNRNLSVVGKLPPCEKEELLELLYDPVLNCYYDPNTQKYYELS